DLNSLGGKRPVLGEARPTRAQAGPKEERKGANLISVAADPLINGVRLIDGEFLADYLCDSVDVVLEVRDYPNADDIRNFIQARVVRVWTLNLRKKTLPRFHTRCERVH